MPKIVQPDYNLSIPVQLSELRDLLAFCKTHKIPPVFVYSNLGIHRTTFAAKSKNRTFTLDEIIMVAHLLHLNIFYTTSHLTA